MLLHYYTSIIKGHYTINKESFEVWLMQSNSSGVPELKYRQNDLREKSEQEFTFLFCREKTNVDHTKSTQAENMLICTAINTETFLSINILSYDLCGIFSSSSQAAQTDNLFKTADAVVSVSVEDVNDNAPEFEQPPYIGTVLENSPVGTVVLNVTVTDLDQVFYL